MSNFDYAQRVHEDWRAALQDLYFTKGASCLCLKIDPAHLAPFFLSFPPLRTVPLVNPAFQNACLRYLRIPQRQRILLVWVLSDEVCLSPFSRHCKFPYGHFWYSYANVAVTRLPKLFWSQVFRHQLDCYIFELMLCGAPAAVYRKRSKFIITVTPPRIPYRISKLPLYARMLFLVSMVSNTAHDARCLPYITVHVFVWYSFLARGWPWRYTSRNRNNHSCLAMRFSWTPCSTFTQSTVV